MSTRFTGRASRLALIIGLFLAAAPCMAQPSKIAHSFEELRSQVVTGDSVTVVDRTGHELTGKILDLSSRLVLMVDSQRRELDQADVSIVYQRRQDSLLNGTLFGLAVGSVLGLVGGISCENDFGCGGSTGEFVLLWGSVGAGVGLGIDALITKRQVIYQRSSGQAARVRVSPVLGRGVTGALVSLSY